MKYSASEAAVKSSSEFRIPNRIIKNAGGVIFIALLLLFHGQAQAQDRIPNKGIQAGNSYSISDIENVDLSNGNLMLNIPVAGLPGRGSGRGVTVAMRYNSKLWSSRHTTEENYSASPDQGGPDYARERLKRSDDGGYDEGGWSLDTGQYRLIERYRLNYEPETACAIKGVGAGSYEYAKNGYAYKLEMKMPDGGAKEFRPYGDGAAYQDYYDTGYFSIDANGTQYIYTYGTSNGHPYCTDSTVSITTTGMNYYSNDGSGIRLFVPHDANDHWTLYYPNGTVVENLPLDDSTVSQRLTDRNNNKVLWKVATMNGHAGMQIINDVGQYVFIYSDANGNTMFSQPGAGGELLTTVVHSKLVYVRRKYQSAAAAAANYNYLYDEVSESFSSVDSITLPAQAGGLQYLFTYNGSDTPVSEGTYTSGFGELKSITLPSGAEADYFFQLDDSTKVPLCIRFTPLYYTNNDGIVLENTVTKRELKYDTQYDGNTSQVTETTLYNIDPFNHTGSVTSPDGGVTTSFGNQAYGLTTTIRPDGSKTESIWALNSAPRVNSSANSYRPSATNAYVKTEYTSITDAGGNLSLTAIKDYDYDKNGNVIEVREYDWGAYGSVDRSSGKPSGIPSGATLKRKTLNTYYNPTPIASDTTTDSPNIYANPLSPKLHNIIKSTEIQNAAGTPVSRTEFYYDDAGSKGNPTETRTWDSTKQATLGAADSQGYKLTSSNYISSTIQYNTYGSPTLTTDAKGIQTQIVYGDVVTPSGTVSGLYPTQTTVAYGTAIAQTATAEYDFYTGLVKSATTLGNTSGENVTSATEYDALGRPTKIKAAVGTPLEIWTQTVYDDVNRMVIVKADVETKGDAGKVGTQFYDQLGRVRLSKTLENSATQSAINETDGIKVQTRYLTTNGYSYQLVSNPYRTATSTAATSEPEMGWTRSKTINTGKHSETETFSGASLPAPWGSNSASTGKVQTDADADRTLVTDQAGKQRISKSNALGQLVNVWEVKAADSSTEAITFGSLNLNGYKTSYVYDTLNNLTTVNQGSQTRSFTYSSLSRLKSANNPESGLISYLYDNNGNLTQKTDARSVVTNYAYDALNRVTQRSYSAPLNLANYQPTPTVVYTYDNLTNAKGKLTKVTSGELINGSIPNPLSVTEYQAFDQLGRVTQSQQWVEGTAYGDPMTYTYNLSGTLIEQKYPSGRVVKNVLDNDGDLSIVQSKKNQTSGYWNYADNFTYTAAGALSSIQLGNGKWESTVFNSRLQPTQIALGTVQNATDKLKLNFDYGTTNNNGNVLSQTITVPTETRNNQTYNGFTAVQTYTYDSLNRIKDATEMIGANQQWKQTFTYDRYGNRNFDEANTTTLPKNCGGAVCATDIPVVNPTINTTTNKNQLNGYTYDNVGNTTKDAQSRKFTYDAENKQTKVETVDANGNPVSTIGEYFYDGDGKRVKKIAGTEATIFVYDAQSKLVAEYANQTAQTPAVSYLTSDHLGSPRINTDANGAVIARHDYQPFGEEIQRASYGADDVREQFATYERDKEIDLDFAQARYYSSKLGRFHSVDPENFGASEDDPQSWNGYAYARNNPKVYTDPDGLKFRICYAGLECNTVSDKTFRDTKPKTGYIYEDGNIYENVTDDSGNVTREFRGTYERISFDEWDDRQNALFFGTGNYVGLTDRAPAMLKLTTIMQGASGAVIAAPLVADLAVGAGVSALEAQLANTILSRGQIARTFISNGQNRLLHKLFTTGIIPKGLTKEAVIAYIEIAKRTIAEGIDKGVQAKRLKQLQEVLKKMK